MQLAFRGRPSKGCNKCRQRKVKCDEAHPNCERCVKGGFDCVYRDEFDLLLRNQTNEIAVKAQKKWRSRAKRPQHHIRGNPCPISLTSPSNSSDSSNTDREKSAEIAYPVNVTMSQDLYQLAYKRFAYDYTLDSSHDHKVDALPGVTVNAASMPMGFLNFAMQQGTPGTCVYHALYATALANYACRLKSFEAAELGSQEYGRAIALLSPTIAEASKQSPLETLTAINLLSIYELLATPFLTHGGSWQAHVNGSCAIINNIYAKEKSIPDDLKGLVTYTVMQMLISKMSLGKPPSIPLSTVHTLIPARFAMGQVLAFMYTTADVLAEWTTAQLATPATDPFSLSIAAETMVRECDALDTKITSVLSEQDATWQPISIPNDSSNVPPWLEPLYSSPNAPKTLVTYQHFWIQHRIAFLRNTRVQCHQHALHAVDVLIAAAPTDAALAFWLDTQTRLETRLLLLVTEALAASFATLTLPIKGKPDAMSSDVHEVLSIRAHILLWPVYRCALALKRETLSQLDTQGSREWAREVLIFFRDVMGFRKCEGFVDNVDGKFGLIWN